MSDTLDGTELDGRPLHDLQLRSLRARLDCRWMLLHLPPLPCFGKLDYDRRLGKGQGGNSGPTWKDC